MQNWLLGSHYAAWSGRTVIFSWDFIFVAAGAIIGMRPEIIEQIRSYIAQAEELLKVIVDTVSDESKGAAEKIVVLIDNVLGILAPIAVGVPPWGTIIAAARTILPLICSLFGIPIPQRSRALMAAEDLYPEMDEADAKAVLAEYAQPR